MLGPNGLVSSADGGWFYVGGWSDRALIRVSRGKTPVQIDHIPVGFNVDNVRWGTDGRVIAAGHISRCPDENPCELSAARVAKVSPDSLSVEQLVDYDGNDFFELGTVAIDADDEIWIGGIYGSFGIARFPQQK
jgi:sugar lactone lactonase YvrE